MRHALTLLAGLLLLHTPLGAEELYLALHGVGDLLGVPPAALGLPGDADELVSERRLETAVRQELEEVDWSAPGAILSGRYGTLLVVHTGEAHQRVHAYLGRLRAHRESLVQLDVVVGRYRQKDLAGIVPHALVGLEEWNRSSFPLTAEQARQLEQVLEQGGRIVDRSTLGAGMGVQVRCERVLESSYVKDLVVEVLGEQSLSTPSVDTLWQGYKLALTCLGRAPGSVTLDVQLQVQSLQEMATYETPVGRIELPVQTSQEQESQVSFPETWSLLLAGLVDPFPLKPGGQGKRASSTSLLVLVTPHRPGPAPAGSEVLPWTLEERDLQERLVSGSLDGEPTLMIHDVRDLLAEVLEFPAPELGLEGGPGEEEEATDHAAGSIEELAAWIQSCVLPGSWQAPQTTLEAHTGNLVVRAPPEVQQLVGLVLRDLRESTSFLISLEVRVLELAPRGTIHMEADGLRVGDALHRWGQTLDPAGLLGQAQEKGSGIQVLTAPTLMTFPAQRASIVIANQISYVSGYEVEVDSSGGEAPAIICDPTVSVLQSGLSLETRATACEGRTEVLLELDLEQSEIARPLREFEIPAWGSNIVFQLPDAWRLSLGRHLQVPDGETVLLRSGSLDLGGDGHQQILLVTVNLVDMQGR